MIKKIIICSILLPFAVFGQSYPNINQSMNFNDWFNGSATGSGSGSITINSNVLTVSFSGSWNGQQMKTGIIMPINVTPSLPNMELGAIKSNTNPSLNTGYYVKIENNNLVFHTFGQSSPYITGCTFSYSGYIQCTTSTLWYRDADGDGYGTQDQSIVGCPTNCAQIYACTQPIGYVTNASDYDDTTANITNIAPQTFYQDADADTFGNPDISVYYSVKPTSYVVDNTDCNDLDATINPNTIWYRDADADGLGDISIFIISCLQPIGYVSNSNDTNDNPFCNYCASFNLIKNEKYMVSAWIKESNPNTPQEQFKNFDKGCISISFKDVAGLPIATPQKFYATGEIIDGWQRIVGEFTVPDTVNDMELELLNENTNSKMVYFDDIRILPSKGNMKSFVYDQKTQRLMAELDENNYSTFYEYDLEGGLVRVKKETEKGVFTIQETRNGNAKTDKP